MKSNRSKLILFGLVISVGLAGVAAGLTALSRRSSADSARVREMAPPLAPPPSPIKSPPAAQEEKIVVERVTIFPYGLEPQEISRPAGPFLLAIDNRAGTEDFSLALLSERNELVHSSAMPKGRARTSKLLTLPPGKYLLVEEGRRDWRCTITITPK